MSGNSSMHVWVEDSTHERGGYWTRATGTSGGAVEVNSLLGPKTQTRGRYLDIASGTREKVEWPSGANITELVVYVTLSTAQITAGTSGVYARIAIDAANDAIANAMLTRASSPSSDVQWIPIPIDEVIRIPLTAALSQGSLGGGRVDVITDEGQALDVWIGGK